MKKLYFLFFVFILGCEPNREPSPKNPNPEKNKNMGTITIYTHRHYPSDQLLFEQFTQKTGITITVRKGNGNELLDKLKLEGQNSPADLFMTADIGMLYQAKTAGVLQKAESNLLKESIPAHLRDPENYWFGLTKRARVIAYHKERVKPEDLSTYEALTEEKWKKKVLIRSSTNVYNQSLLASFIVANGEEKANTWVQQMVKQSMARKPVGNDRDQVKALAEGLGDIAIINTYYYGLLLHSTNEQEVEVAKSVGLFFPNQGDRGTHINISGAGVTASSKNKKEAIQLLEFLVQEESQKQFAEVNYEYPVHPKVAPSDFLKSLGTFKEDSVSLEEVGKQNKKAVQLFDQNGWE